MPLYFTSQGVAFGQNAIPSVFVHYDYAERALLLNDSTDQAVLGDLDETGADMTRVRAMISDLAVLKEPFVTTQTIDSKVEILSSETDSFVTAGGIQAQFVRIQSDQNLKTDIAPLDQEDTKHILNDYCPFLYRYINGSSLHAGVLAQDLLRNGKTAPFVTKNNDGALTVDFCSYMFCLIQGLRTEVRDLRSELNSLKKDDK